MDKQFRPIKPMSFLDYGAILDKWNDAFDNDISSGTSRWELIGNPVMPGKDTTKVVLVFEQEVVVNDSDVYSINKYRVLLYDITLEPILLRSSEFQYTDSKVDTAWFLENKIYVARRNHKGQYFIDTITNEGKFEALKIGYGVTAITTNLRGDILVGYDCGSDDPDKREPIYLYKRGEGDNEVLESEAAVSADAITVDSHDCIWSYVRPYNYIQYKGKKEHKSFNICYSGFNGLGVSDNGKVLIGSIPYRYGGHRLVAFKLKDDWFGEPIELALDTGDDVYRSITDCEFNGNKALFRVNGHLYMYNINELTWKEMEDKPSRKDSKKKRN